MSGEIFDFIGDMSGVPFSMSWRAVGYNLGNQRFICMQIQDCDRSTAQDIENEVIEDPPTPDASFNLVVDSGHPGHLSACGVTVHPVPTVPGVHRTHHKIRRCPTSVST